MRRKTLARRNPEVVYLIRKSEPGEPGRIFIRGWAADDYGHIDKTQAFGNAHFDEDFDLPRSIWYSSKDTDGLYALPEKLREGIWEYDDAIRAEMRRRKR